MGLPMLYHYGLHSADSVERAKINPLGTSVAHLDPEWEECVKEAYKAYIRTMVRAKRDKKCEGTINKIILPTNTYKLSLARINAAKANPDTYLNYADPRLIDSVLAEDYIHLSIDKIQHQRNYDKIHRILKEKDAEWILEKIAVRSVKVIEEAIQEISDEFDEIKMDDFIITSDIGPEMSHSRELSVSRRSNSYFEAYHAPTIKALAKAGVNYIQAGSISLISEAYGIADACEKEETPFVISFLPSDDTQSLYQTKKPIAEVIADLAEDYQKFLHAGLNCRGPEQLSQTILNVRDYNNPRLVDADRIERINPTKYLSKAYANGSRLPPTALDRSIKRINIDPDEYVSSMSDLVRKNPHVRTIGGCCGTDWEIYSYVMPEIAKKLKPEIDKQHKDYLEATKFTASQSPDGKFTIIKK